MLLKVPEGGITFMFQPFVVRDFEIIGCSTYPRPERTPRNETMVESGIIKGNLWLISSK